jgi:hypothetical protein
MISLIQVGDYGKEQGTTLLKLTIHNEECLGRENPLHLQKL